MAVAIPSAFEGASSHTSVGFTMAVIKPFDCCSVNQATNQAVTFEGTVRPIIVPTVACPFNAILLVGVNISIFSVSITFSCFKILLTNITITVSEI